MMGPVLVYKEMTIYLFCEPSLIKKAAVYLMCLR